MRTINAGPNPRYFGTRRGVTYRNFTSDQFTGFSELVFGLFRLLGYQFSPRLTDLGEARFWRLDRGADYGSLNALARYHINPKLIRTHWEDMLRVAGSLAFGNVKTTELVRALQGGRRPTTLGRAIAEYGRISKTLHLLHVIDDESYRRQILIQLNCQEGRHSRALDQLRAEGNVLRDEDIERLSPLVHEHINLYGRYYFGLPEAVQRGELRVLRDPRDAIQEL